jgi:hypothetical protein
VALGIDAENGLAIFQQQGCGMTEVLAGFLINDNLPGSFLIQVNEAGQIGLLRRLGLLGMSCWPGKQNPGEQQPGKKQPDQSEMKTAKAVGGSWKQTRHYRLLLIKKASLL